MNVTLKSSLYNGSTTIENSATLAPKTSTKVADVPYAGIDSFDGLNTLPSISNKELESLQILYSDLQKPRADCILNRIYEICSNDSTDRYTGIMGLYFMICAFASITKVRSGNGYVLVSAFDGIMEMQYNPAINATGEIGKYGIIGTPPGVNFEPTQDCLITQTGGLPDANIFTDMTNELRDFLEEYAIYHDYEDFLNAIEDKNVPEFVKGFISNARAISDIVNRLLGVNLISYFYNLRVPDPSDRIVPINPNDLFEECQMFNYPCLLITIRFEIIDVSQEARFDGNLHITLGAV